MRTLWELVNKLDVSVIGKNHVFIFCLAIVSGLIGAIVWFLLGKIFLPDISWFICFVGYPCVFIGYFGGVIYLYNHEFKSEE